MQCVCLFKDSGAKLRYWEKESKKRLGFCVFKKYLYLCNAFEKWVFSKSIGEVAEWSIAAVLKTVVPRGTRGSNPCLSASQVFIVGLTKFWRDAGVVDRAAFWRDAGVVDRAALEMR